MVRWSEREGSRVARSREVRRERELWRGTWGWMRERTWVRTRECTWATTWGRQDLVWILGWSWTGADLGACATARETSRTRQTTLPRGLARGWLGNARHEPLAGVGAMQKCQALLATTAMCCPGKGLAAQLKRWVEGDQIGITSSGRVSGRQDLVDTVPGHGYAAGCGSCSPFAWNALCANVMRAHTDVQLAVVAPSFPRVPLSRASLLPPIRRSGLKQQTPTPGGRRCATTRA